MAYDLFLSALPHFEFPRFDLYSFDNETKAYSTELSKEEQNIIAIYMVVEWFGQ